MYRSKREVLSSIKHRSFVKNGEQYTIFTAFLGRDPKTNEKKRIARASEKELKEYIAEFYKKLDKGGDSAVALDHAQSADAAQALDLIAQHGLAMTLVECVRAVLDGRTVSATDCKTTLGEAWTRFLAEHIAHTSPANQRAVKSRVGAWVSKAGSDSPLSAVTAAGVKEYLLANVYRASDPTTAKTYNNVLGDIHTFMRWCASVEQKLLSADPLDGMKKMPVGYRPPKYAKAEDVARLFAVLERHKADAPADLADAILSFLCGMRQCEIERVREGENAVKISLEDHFIRVIKCKGSTRGIRPRAFRIPEQAEAWMRSFDFLAAVQEPNPSFREHLVARAKEAKIALPKNAGRHTFITMYEAAHHDTNALSGIVGNTDAVRSKSYNGVELEREGKAYFRILPTAESGTPKEPRPAVAEASRPASDSPADPVSAAS